MIYFDHNATAPYSASVKKYLQSGIMEDWYNPSSSYKEAQVLNQRIRDCRNFIAEYLDCSSKQLFFTGNGTESINTVLSLETLKLNGIKSVITSLLEHDATTQTTAYLRSQNIPIHYVANNQNGEINLDDLEKLCQQNPHSLVSLLSSNNETGVITDVLAIKEIAKKYQCLIHIDAVQSLGKIPVNLQKWDVDFISFSGHKIGAMKGIGLLYSRRILAPLLFGGGQERKIRSGTYNFPAIYSLKLAVEDISLDKNIYVSQLRDNLELSLFQMTPNFTFFKVNCQTAPRLCNTSNIYCGGMSNYQIQNFLMKKNIAISIGSACKADSTEPSYVIQALGYDKEYARSCIRVSLSKKNTQKEVEFFIDSLREIISKDKNLLTEIDGQGSPEEVSSRIKDSLMQEV